MEMAFTPTLAVRVAGGFDGKHKSCDFRVITIPSKRLMVTGRVADKDAVLNVVAKTLIMLVMNLNSCCLGQMKNTTGSTTFTFSMLMSYLHIREKTPIVDNPRGNLHHLRDRDAKKFNTSLP